MTAAERWFRSCWPTAECYPVTFEGRAGYVVIAFGTWQHDRPEPTPAAAWVAANEAAGKAFAGERS